jgi:catechol 2,3-dioxygenase-like lactoylglutathione lyase family enzyme
MIALESPTHAVVGVSDPNATARFLEPFGFEVVARGELATATAERLYGLAGPCVEWRLAAPGAERGGVRLVQAPGPARTSGVFDHRAFAIDLFTRDIERSLAVGREAGARCSRIADHRFGPMLVREAEVHGPDGLVVTLLQSGPRRPSRLDAQPDALHSEVHSFVWSVADADEVARFWQERAGFKRVTDFSFGGTTLSIALGLDEREIRARFLVLIDAADHPIRMQLLQFLDEAASPVAGFPLAPGLHGVAFEVADLDAARAGLVAARFGEVAEVAGGTLGAARAIAGEAPGGLRFELWQRRG